MRAHSLVIVVLCQKGPAGEAEPRTPRRDCSSDDLMGGGERENLCKNKGMRVVQPWTGGGNDRAKVKSR